MKPADWIIQDIGSLRKKRNRTEHEESYLKLLLWYVQDAIKLTHEEVK